MCIVHLSITTTSQQEICLIKKSTYLTDELQPEPKRSVADMHQVNEGQPRTQRPSLLIDLLTGDLGSRSHSNRTPVETPCSNSSVTGGQPASAHHSVSSASNATKTSLQSQVSAGPNGVNARGEDQDEAMETKLVGIEERMLEWTLLVLAYSRFRSCMATTSILTTTVAT